MLNYFLFDKLIKFANCLINKKCHKNYSLAMKCYSSLSGSLISLYCKTNLLSNKLSCEQSYQLNEIHLKYSLMLLTLN